MEPNLVKIKGYKHCVWKIKGFGLKSFIVENLSQLKIYSKLKKLNNKLFEIEVKLSLREPSFMKPFP